MFTRKVIQRERGWRVKYIDAAVSFFRLVVLRMPCAPRLNLFVFSTRLILPTWCLFPLPMALKHGTRLLRLGATKHPEVQHGELFCFKSRAINHYPRVAFYATSPALDSSSPESKEPKSYTNLATFRNQTYPPEDPPRSIVLRKLPSFALEEDVIGPFSRPWNSSVGSTKAWFSNWISHWDHTKNLTDLEKESAL